MPNRISIGRSVRSAAVGTMLYLLGAALFAGSVQARTTVKGTWQEGAPRKQSFSRVLVVGVSPNVNQRCAFEFFMACSWLGNESKDVVPHSRRLRPDCSLPSPTLPWIAINVLCAASCASSA